MSERIMLLETYDICLSVQRFKLYSVGVQMEMAQKMWTELNDDWRNEL